MCSVLGGVDQSIDVCRQTRRGRGVDSGDMVVDSDLDLLAMFLSDVYAHHTPACLTD